MDMEQREKQIKDIAEKFYLNEEQPLSDDMEKYRAFIRGAEWADKSPSDDMILRAVALYAEATLMWNKLKMDRMDYPEKWVDSEGFKLDYIKSHWND